MSRKNATNVIQKPGAVFVRWRPGSLSVSCLRKTNNAISMAKAISVSRAARNDVKEDRSVTVIWVEKASTKAKKVTAVATG